MSYEFWHKAQRVINEFNYEIGCIQRVEPVVGDELEKRQRALMEMIEEGLSLTEPYLDDDQYYCPFSENLVDKYQPILQKFSEDVEVQKDIYAKKSRELREKIDALSPKKKVKLTKEENEQLNKWLEEYETLSYF